MRKMETEAANLWTHKPETGAEIQNEVISDVEVLAWR